MDPLKIINQKYDDLKKRHSIPWDLENNPTEFLPETGRIDPLTRVSDAVPDDLKPPRSGDTDENDITTYLRTQRATEAVLFVEFSLQCNSVIQIGLVKFVNLEIYGIAFTVTEGSGLPIPASNGVTVMVTCTKISTSEVDCDLTVGPASNPIVTKSVVFIPKYSNY